MLSKLMSANLALYALVLVVVVVLAAAVLIGLGHPVPSWFVTIGLTGLATSLGHATVTSLAASSPNGPQPVHASSQLDARPPQAAPAVSAPHSEPQGGGTSPASSPASALGSVS